MLMFIYVLELHQGINDLILWPGICSNLSSASTRMLNIIREEETESDHNIHPSVLPGFQVSLFMMMFSPLNLRNSFRDEEDQSGPAPRTGHWLYPCTVNTLISLRSMSSSTAP